MNNREGIASVLQQCRSMGWVVDLTQEGALNVSAPTENPDPHLQGILEANRKVIHEFLADNAQRLKAPSPSSFTWTRDH